MSNDDPLPDTRPFTLAAAFLRSAGLAEVKMATTGGGKDVPVNVKPTNLRHWREDYFKFTGSSYEQIHIEKLRPELNAFLNRQFYFAGEDNRVKPLRVNTGLKRDVFDQIRDLVQAAVDAMPAWLDGRPEPEPRDVLAFQNGLLDIPQWLHDDGIPLLKPTAQWFSTSTSPCDYDPAATCHVWLKLLSQSLSDDDELIETLQEWFGYCLTSDTSLQKMLWMHGTGGAGKGTILRTMRRVIGEKNTIPFDLWTLGDRFTLSGFINKRLAISGDAVLDNNTDSRKIMGRLNGISGEDPQGIDRKNRDLLEGIHLTTRFVISINQFPRMPESGNAMGRRAVLIPFKKSFTDAEDTTLDSRLARETAGITNWALVGLRRLRERGQFRETTAGSELRKRFVSIMFPIKGFVDDCLVITPYQANNRRSVSGYAAVDDVYAAYVLWCKKNGHKPSAKPHFGENIHDAVAGLVRVKAGDENQDGRFYQYRGIELQPHIIAEMTPDF